MNKFWTSIPLIPAIAMCAALTACSGASREQTAGDVEEYCASVKDADDICANSEPGADSTQPAPPAEQTGFNKIGPGGAELPPGDLVFF
jgi:hypothetical protein